jgi:hypothetical protein
MNENTQNTEGGIFKVIKLSENELINIFKALNPQSFFISIRVICAIRIS